MKTLRIGTRASPLAVVQARIVADAIRKADPSLDVQLVPMTTTGDRLAKAKLADFGGKGLFVKELDLALLEGRVDLTVHSFKDLPMDLPPELPLAAVSSRADPRDALVLPAGQTTVPVGPWGCSSARRTVQLAEKQPDLLILPVRGNVQTRLAKLDRGDFAALVLAAAGLKRAGLAGRISRFFSADELLPAACQGILAVQGRRGEAFPCLEPFHSAEAWDAALAERAFVRALGGGCGLPVAAYAEIHGEELFLRGLFQKKDGTLWHGQKTGPREKARALGTALAEEALKPQNT